MYRHASLQPSYFQSLPLSPNSQPFSRWRWHFQVMVEYGPGCLSFDGGWKCQLEHMFVKWIKHSTFLSIFLSKLFTSCNTWCGKYKQSPWTSSRRRPRKCLPSMTVITFRIKSIPLRSWTSCHLPSVPGNTHPSSSLTWIVFTLSWNKGRFICPSALERSPP